MGRTLLDLCCRSKYMVTELMVAEPVLAFSLPHDQSHMHTPLTAQPSMAAKGNCSNSKVLKGLAIAAEGLLDFLQPHLRQLRPLSRAIRWHGLRVHAQA